MTKQDNVYAEAQKQIVDFVFDEKVVAVFPDMIRRSVPGYETVIPLAGLIAARHAAQGGNCYDLGCSLGASTLALLRQLPAPRSPECQIIAVDNSPAMLQQAQKNLANEGDVTWLEADIREVKFERAAVVIANFTLQFLPPEDRLSLLKRIRTAMLPHAVLIVSEKICFEDEQLQHDFNKLHLAYKRANGYSELEISQKRSALEKIMLPDTIATHEARFSAAGFKRCEVWFRCLNWASFLVYP